MERILVTGGAGFIGSHLCERLVMEGNDVICVDNYFTGSKDNIRHLLGSDRFEAVRHDVTTPYYAEVDKVYNLACPASPVYYQYNPIKTLKTSIYGTLNMLGLAKRVHAKILHTSTSEVYGDPTIHPQPESYWGNVNPIGIRSCYDEGKRAAETLCMDYHRQHGIRVHTDCPVCREVARLRREHGLALARNTVNGQIHLCCSVERAVGTQVLCRDIARCCSESSLARALYVLCMDVLSLGIQIATDTHVICGEIRLRCDVNISADVHIFCGEFCSCV